MPQTSQKSAAEMVGEAKERVENLTVEQVAEEMEKDGVVLIDIREGGELLENGRILGWYTHQEGCSNSGRIPQALITARSSILTGARSSTAPRVDARRSPLTRSGDWATRTSPTSTGVSRPGKRAVILLRIFRHE